MMNLKNADAFFFNKIILHKKALKYHVEKVNIS